MAETRVDLLHLQEDLRDAYPSALEETSSRSNCCANHKPDRWDRGRPRPLLLFVPPVLPEHLIGQRRVRDPKRW